MIEWQPIENAPKDGTRIIVCTKTRKRLISYWHQPANPDYAGFWVGVSCPTLWMPLPDPPITARSGHGETK